MIHKRAIKFRRIKIKKNPLPKGKIILFILLGLFFSIFIVSFFNNTGLWNAGSVISENLEENKTAIIRAVIEIDNAEHLNSERNFISDITNEVKFFDDVWSEEISDGEYVRVTFEEELDSSRDIMIYPRIVSGEPRIEVYEKGENEIIAEFTSINSNEYNKVFLTNLQGSQDVFDLRILDGSIEIEHIVDPEERIKPVTPDNVSQWDGVGGSCTVGTHYDCVNEDTPDDETSYVACIANAVMYDFYNTNTSFTTENIKNVTVNSCM